MHSQNPLQRCQCWFWWHLVSIVTAGHRVLLYHQRQSVQKIGVSTPLAVGHSTQDGKADLVDPWCQKGRAHYNSGMASFLLHKILQRTRKSTLHSERRDDKSQQEWRNMVKLVQATSNTTMPLEWQWAEGSFLQRWLSIWNCPSESPLERFLPPKQIFQPPIRMLADVQQQCPLACEAVLRAEQCMIYIKQSQLICIISFNAFLCGRWHESHTLAYLRARCGEL